MLEVQKELKAKLEKKMEENKEQVNAMDSELEETVTEAQAGGSTSLETSEN